MLAGGEIRIYAQTLEWRTTTRTRARESVSKREKDRRGNWYLFVFVIDPRVTAPHWLFRPCHGKGGESSVGAGASFQAMRTISQLQSGDSMDELAKAQWLAADRARG